jgi:hypothetical protein
LIIRRCGPETLLAGGSRSAPDIAKQEGLEPGRHSMRRMGNESGVGHSRRTPTISWKKYSETRREIRRMRSRQRAHAALSLSEEDRLCSAGRSTPNSGHERRRRDRRPIMACPMSASVYVRPVVPTDDLSAELLRSKVDWLVARADPRKLRSLGSHRRATAEAGCLNGKLRAGQR